MKNHVTWMIKLTKGKHHIVTEYSRKRTFNGKALEWELIHIYSMIIAYLSSLFIDSQVATQLS